jgi:hypothetical protein
VPGWRYKLVVLAAKYLPQAWMLALMNLKVKKYRKVD